MSSKTVLKPGDVFNHWTLKERIYNQDNKQIGWLCFCSCGKEVQIENITTIVKGKSKSCGCLRKKLLSESNPMHKQEIRDKVSSSIKSNQVAMDRFKTISQLANTPEARAKREATNLEKYGTISPAGHSSVKEKTANTNLARYGGIAPAHNPSVLKKMQDTCIAKYGVANIMLLDEYKEKVGNSSSKTKRDNGITTLSDGRPLVDWCSEKGLLATSARNIMRKYGQEVLENWIVNYDGTGSSLEQYAIKILVDAGLNAVSYNKQVPELAAIGHKYKPDIKVTNGDISIFIDIDGLYYHVKADTKYHLRKRIDYASAGIALMQIREDELLFKTDIFLSMVKSRLNLSNKVGARECTIEDMSFADASAFMLNNHLMGPGASAKTINLTKDGKVLMALSYTKYRDGVDISRIATERGFLVRGGVTRLLAEVERREKPRFIQSFVDLRYATGNSLSNNGFTLKGTTLGWQWTDKHVTMNRRFCTANMDDRGLSEAEHARELRLLKIYDAGQAKYVKYCGGDDAKPN